MCGDSGVFLLGVKWLSGKGGCFHFLWGWFDKVKSLEWKFFGHVGTKGKLTWRRYYSGLFGRVEKIINCSSLFCAEQLKKLSRCLADSQIQCPSCRTLLLEESQLPSPKPLSPPLNESSCSCKFNMCRNKLRRINDTRVRNME